LLCRKERTQCSCRAMRKQWKFSCHTSPTLDPSMGRFNLTTSKIDRAGLTMIRISDSSIPFPSDCINVLRSRPFAFSARRCNKFSVDRVLLAGDAAHVFPPCKYPPGSTSQKVLTRNSWRSGDCFWFPRRFWPSLAPCNCNPIKHKELCPTLFRMV
jgi:hypothetical protein